MSKLHKLADDPLAMALAQSITTAIDTFLTACKSDQSRKPSDVMMIITGTFGAIAGALVDTNAHEEFIYDAANTCILSFRINLESQLNAHTNRTN